MRFFLFFILSLSIANAFAEELMPIRKHLKDATKLNRERRQHYERLNAESTAVINELILMERLALLATYRLDKKAQPYLQKGIFVFHDDLIDMAYTPKFSTRYVDDNYPKERIKTNISEYKKRWLKDLKNESLDSIYQEAVYLLEEGELKATNQNCLTRHFVESVARSLMLYETHREGARLANLKDPKDLILSFVKLQISTLKWTQSLDKRAYPIQAAGIPLFCQDVPVVPYK